MEPGRNFDHLDLGPEGLRVLLDVEREFEPAYCYDMDGWLTPAVMALSKGFALCGVARDGCRAMALPDGRFQLDGVEVKVAINVIDDPFEAAPDRTEMGVACRSLRDRARKWCPTFQFPGTPWDAAWAFFGVMGWQRAEMIARRALGCEVCVGGVVEVEGAGAGRHFEECSCQLLDSEQEEIEETLLPLPRPDDVLAREEPGEWYVTKSRKGKLR